MEDYLRNLKDLEGSTVKITIMNLGFDNFCIIRVFFKSKYNIIDFLHSEKK